MKKKKKLNCDCKVRKKKVKFFEIVAGMDPRGAQKGPGLIVIVKREKMSKSLNLMQNGPNPNSNRKRDKMLKSLN